MTIPRSASARATNRQRWQSSGSRSAHVMQTRCRAAGRVTGRGPIGIQDAPPSPRSRRRRRGRGRLRGRPPRESPYGRSHAFLLQPGRERRSRKTTESGATPASSARRRSRSRRRLAASPTKRSIGMLEWPMLNRSKVASWILNQIASANSMTAFAGRCGQRGRCVAENLQQCFILQPYTTPRRLTVVALLALQVPFRDALISAGTARAAGVSNASLALRGRQ